MKTGTVYWITGLSGAGKTTIGKKLYKTLKQKKENVVFLDGDDLRTTIAVDLGYTEEERHESAWRNVRLCKLLADQGLDVICCTICMFSDIREWNRENNQNYREIYVKVPMEKLKKRNQKGLYEDRISDLVGVGIGMEEPQNPDCVLINDGSRDIETVFRELLDTIRVEV